MVAADALHVPWGTRLTDEFSYKLHPVRDGGAGNPLIFYRHPGGGSAESHIEIWDQGGAVSYEMNQFLTYIMSPSRAVHFDVVSIETPQMSFDVAKIPRSQRTFCPAIITAFQKGLRNASMIMKDLGSDPERKGIFAASHGAWLSLMSMLWQPEFGGSGQRLERHGRFDTKGYNSRCKFAFLELLAYPDFRKLCTPSGLTFSSGTIAGSPSTITAAGAFTHYRYTPGDQVIFTIPGGAQYTATIASKTSANAILLTSTPVTASPIDGYVSTDQVDLFWSGMLYGTRPKDAPDAFGNPDYAEWDALPLGCKEAVSPLKWIEDNRLDFMAPTYFWSDTTQGNGIKPYGNSYDPGSGIHDWHGAKIVSDALAAKGKDSRWEGQANYDAWTDFSMPARLYDWMVARINS